MFFCRHNIRIILHEIEKPKTSLYCRQYNYNDDVNAEYSITNYFEYVENHW